MQKIRRGVRNPAGVTGVLRLVTIGACFVASLAVAADESSMKDFSMSQEKGGGSTFNKGFTLVGDQALAFQGGYILPHHEQVTATLLGTREIKNLFGAGDVLFIRFTKPGDYRVGDRFTLYRPDHVVFHPVTNAMMGHLIKILGIVEVTTAPANLIAEARIVRSFDGIRRGDPLMPFQVPNAVTEQASTDHPMILGNIADFMVSRQVTAQGDIVYIDKGAAEGVAIGDWFYIIRPAKHTAFLDQLPDENVAELRIIGLQDHTATGLVTVTSDALRRGDIVVGGPTRLGTQRAKVEELAVVPLEPVPVLTPLADILFAFDQYLLSEKAKTDLAQVRAVLKDNPSAKLLILGYADERGSSEYNLTLGKRRATEVQQYLASLGLQNPMTTSSFGEERPICPEHTEECYTANRRVQVVLENN
jgi:outer membrane protein OmpA-like peptidoglycan-associated protein